MKIADNPLVKAELDNLQLQFGNKSSLTLDDYAVLYGIGRRNASRHLRRRDIPVSKEGRELYISMLDLAIYKVKHKSGSNGPAIPIVKNDAAEMKRRRGFSQAAARRQLS